MRKPLMPRLVGLGLATASAYLSLDARAETFSSGS
jgi:hypothetical protein